MSAPPNPNAMNQEIELKLNLPASILPMLRHHPIVAGTQKQGRATTLHNTYFDTPDFALKARKIAVRTRKQGRDWLQTVKCAATSTAGLSQRPEWEQAYRGQFDFSAVDIPEVAETLALYRDALAPAFTTRFRRETRLYTPRDGVRILLMIDTGTIEAGTRTEAIHELELELESGTELDLLDLACELTRDLPLLPSDLSKAARGYRLFHNQVPQAEQAALPSLTTDHSALDAFRELAHACLRQWQANANIAIAVGIHGDAYAECLHQLRVALRRLRSLVRIFSPILPDAFVPTWNERLRDLAAGLSDSRDIEVLHETVLDPLIAHNGIQRIDGLPRLLTCADNARLRARETSLSQIARHGHALLAFGTALHRLPESARTATVPLKRLARRRLTGLRKSVRRRFKAASPLTPAKLHALRIALKRLRYGTEFFAPLFASKASLRYLKRLARAQTTLGHFSDADSARGLLQAWADSDDTLRAATARIVNDNKGKRLARRQRRALRKTKALLWSQKPW